MDNKQMDSEYYYHNKTSFNHDNPVAFAGSGHCQTQQPQSYESHQDNFMTNNGQQSIAPLLPPTQVANCPPGLEYLLTIDQILVHQKIELCQTVCGCETNNKYELKNSLGQKIYSAQEDTDCCTRQCCGPMRPFDLAIVDNQGIQVLHLYRPLRCTSFCCWCCLQELEVKSPNGELLGTIQQDLTFFLPRFSIKNAQDECVMKIKVPCLIASCTCSDIEFPIYSAYDETARVATITKQWSGLGRELFTTADHFGVTFPIDLDVNMKAVLLGATFLIDFLYYENKN